MNQPIEVRMLEGLVPPPDHELECLVATTYSLDPAVFLAIISAASFDWASLGGSVGFEGLSKEEWRRVLLEKRHRCVLFADHHGAFETGGAGFTSLEKLSFDQVIKRSGRDTQVGGSLHAKLVVALFRNSRGTVLGRVLIGSKNFTGSRMREFGAVYDLRTSRGAGRNPSFTRGLVGYLEYLKKGEAGKTETLRTRPLDLAIGLLRKEGLQVADPSLRFHWQGRGLWQSTDEDDRPLHEQIAPLLNKPWHGVFVHSPWARVTAAAFLAKHVSTDVAIRIQCLKEPGLSTLSQPNVFYQMSHSATGTQQPHQSHSKIYFFSRENKSLLIFGSANFTSDGLGIASSPGCRPNSEILVSTQVKASDYRYLADIRGNPEDVKARKPGETEKERVLSLLNSVQVGVSYFSAKKCLVYEIETRKHLDGFKRDIKISHDLIEETEGDAGSEIEVCNEWPIPARKEISWERSELLRVSCLVRIKCPALDIESHLVVDLDAQFYEGRKNLRILQYESGEILASLARLMDIAVPEGGADDDHRDGTDPYEQQLHALLDGLRVERYAYKLARLKAKEPSTYLTKVGRVTSLLSEARKDTGLAANGALMRLCGILDRVHEELGHS